MSDRYKVEEVYDVLEKVLVSEVLERLYGIAERRRIWDMREDGPYFRGDTYFVQNSGDVPLLVRSNIDWLEGVHGNTKITLLKRVKQTRRFTSGYGRGQVYERRERAIAAGKVAAGKSGPRGRGQDPVGEAPGEEHQAHSD